MGAVLSSLFFLSSNAVVPVPLLLDAEDTIVEVEEETTTEASDNFILTSTSGNLYASTILCESRIARVLITPVLDVDSSVQVAWICAKRASRYQKFSRDASCASWLSFGPAVRTNCFFAAGLREGMGR